MGEGDDARTLATHEMGVLGGGDTLRLQAGKDGARLVLVAGRPLREPVPRHGPFVMNTREELMQAFVDFPEGRFSARCLQERTAARSFTAKARSPPRAPQQ